MSWYGPPVLCAVLCAALVLSPAALAAAQEATASAPPARPPAAEVAGVVYPGGHGPGAGRHVVLVAGDEEYRSEEALPMLARVLAERHGFRCTVLWSLDEEGAIDPDARGNIPGLAALDTADALVLFTRFRRLPDDDMAHLVAFVEAGKPLLGIRTATHGFAYAPDDGSPFAHWSWDATAERNAAGWAGGFGKQVLGETWVAHHGAHGSESTRGIVPEAVRAHPLLRGVADVWGPTDVYAVGPLPADAVVLLEGAVLSGMSPDDLPLDDPRNAPRMPVAWARERPLPDGRTQRVVASTIGAAVDLQCEDLRRLFVNAVYWGLGLEVPERADVATVSAYEPTMFGFGAFVKGRRPADFELPAR